MIAVKRMESISIASYLLLRLSLCFFIKTDSKKGTNNKIPIKSPIVHVTNTFRKALLGINPAIHNPVTPKVALINEPRITGTRIKTATLLTLSRMCLLGNSFFIVLTPTQIHSKSPKPFIEPANILSKVEGDSLLKI